MVRRLNIGDTVQVNVDDQNIVGEIVDIGEHPPYEDCVMISGIHYWFKVHECRLLRFAS